MEILDLRHFSAVDLRPLLDDETQVWERLLSWDYSGSAAMILRYVDAKILPGYAAVDRGRIFGYAFFVYEGSKGVIGDLFVANGGRLPDPHAVETQLLVHVIETLQQSPGINRVEAQLLAHETGVVAQPFVDQGFHRHARLFMVLPLENSARPATSLRTDIEIRRWSEQDYQPAAAIITSAYRGHVDSEINDQYRTLSGSLRFLNNIVRFPGLRHLRSRVFIRGCASQDADLVGIDSVFPGASRCGSRHPGLCFAGIPFEGYRRGLTGVHHQQSSPTEILVCSR